jgi:predicted PurR-regulated permease PerM
VAKVPSYARTVRERVEPWVQRMNLRYPEETEQVRDQIERALKENNVAIVARVTSVLKATFSNLLSFVLTVLNLVVIPIFAIYLLYDMNRIRHGLGELVPGRYRPYIGARMLQVDTLLSAWVRGQLTVAFMLGVFYAIGLTACGVPMGLLVGFVIGFFNLVPFMSYVLGLPIALLLSVIDDQSLARAIAVVVVFSFGQFVEGNFITPRIVGDQLGLHAVVIMLAVLVGGTLFGFTGMLLALPVTAALSVFWDDLRDLYLRSPFYRGGDGAGPAPPPVSAL